MQIPIPDFFAAMNKRLASGQLEAAKEDYLKAVNGASLS